MLLVLLPPCAEHIEDWPDALAQRGQAVLHPQGGTSPSSSTSFRRLATSSPDGWSPRHGGVLRAHPDRFCGFGNVPLDLSAVFTAVAPRLPEVVG